MNTFIKRTVKLGLATLFIGTAVVPACAQKKDLIKKLPEALGKNPSLTNVTPTANILNYMVRNSISATPALSQLSGQTQASMQIQVAPKGPLSFTNAQLRAGITPQPVSVSLDNMPPMQLTNAAYLWLQNNSGKTLKENPALQKKVLALLEKDEYSPAEKIVLPMLRRIKGSGRVIKSFAHWAETNTVYSHNIQLNEFGLPDQNTKSIYIEPYLLAADPVEMGAFVIHPTLVDLPEIRLSALALTEPERVAIETLFQKRLTRAAIPLESSAREVLQVAYDYFITQQVLNEGYPCSKFVYRYRTDLPFEKLTAAEKEAFIVHKLIRHKLKTGNPQDADIAHLRLLDYVASQQAKGLISHVDGGYYDTIEGLREALQAYNVFHEMGFRTNLEWAAYDLFENSFKNLLWQGECSPETIMDLYNLLPIGLLKDSLRERVIYYQPKH